MINKILVLTEFQNGCNKVVIELRVVQFWSEIILVISNQTRAARSSDFQITRMISDQIALHSVRLPLFINYIHFEITSNPCNPIGSPKCDLFTNHTIFALNHTCSCSSENFENSTKRYQNLALWACLKFISIPKRYQFNNNNLYNCHCKF